MEKKQCGRCGATKPLIRENFRTEKRNKNGFSGTCKVCEEVLKRSREARNKNKQKPKLTSLCCTKCNIEKPATDEFFHKHSRSRTGFKSACKECRKIETRKWNASEACKTRARNRRKNDPAWKLKKNVGSSIARSMASRGNKKEASCFEYLDYTAEELRVHLEEQFEPWMSWENWGKASNSERTWHIDHIYPHSKLPYDSLEHPNFKKCWALENLRPLCAIENIKKKDKVLDNNNE